jgi:glycogen operon protein
VEAEDDLLRFTRALIAFRQRRDEVVEGLPLSLAELLRRRSIQWHGVQPFQPDWGPESRSLALTLTSVDHRFRLHLIVNAWWQELVFTLPPTALSQGDDSVTGEPWHRWIDTALASPDDIVSWRQAPPVDEPTYKLQPRSVVALVVGHAGAG